MTKARAAVRQINSAMTGDIVILIAKGDYPVTETISFTEQDSGTNGNHVIYQNEDAIGSARLSGQRTEPGQHAFRPDWQRL